ncbi:MAG TPA: helix-turn-helix transcriptional regulator [Terriglobia bacterium]|nr:helix-turn-helix transcriptional regulator [Terriglobia bacterium]
MQTLKVLGALVSRPGCGISGAEIGRTAKLRSGTLYPTLLRLERAGWLESRWEDANPHDLGRPRRRYYRLTALGARNARLAFDEVTASVGGLAWG